MAKAKKLPSGNWRVQVYDYTDKDDKRHYKSFTAGTKKEAEYAAAEYALNKKSIKPEKNITFGEALDNYILRRTSILSPSTIREYKRSRKTDLKDLMQINIYDITQAQIQEVINKESKNHSPKSVRNMHGLLSAVMKDNRPDFAINTDLPEKVRPKIYVPSDEQIKALMKAAENTEMEIPILLAAFGPMRRSEICALESDHINNGTVHVEYAMVLNDNHQWVIKQPKSYAGNRYIDFPEFVVNKLQGISGRIVQLTPSQVSDRFSNILKRADIPHFRFHDLRHYCASIQHAIGIPDAYIMQRGGWGSDGVLKSVYRHAMDGKNNEMNQKANNYFEKMQHEMQHKK